LESQVKKKYPHLNHRNIDPPGGWRFKDIDTNMWIVSLRNLDDLIQQCCSHRRANELQIPDDFAEFVEASICYACPPEISSGFPDDRKMSERATSLYQVLRNTNVFLLNWRLKGNTEKVIQDEANTRAFVCVKCKYNNKTLCLSCHGHDQWINGWTGRKTKHDAALGVCACDGIILYATIHSTLKTSGEFPDHCWKKTKQI